MKKIKYYIYKLKIFLFWVAKMLEEKILTLHEEYAKCANCGVNRWWGWGQIKEIMHKDKNDMIRFSVWATQCGHCGQVHIFHQGDLVYPRMSAHVKTHELLNNYPKAKKLFEESLAVASDSPRAGLALSRMCLECLIHEILDQADIKPEPNFSHNVEKLLKLEIINLRIKVLLDDTRVIGNKSLHNFNVIDTENEITFEDCIIVWKAINHILDSLKLLQELDKDLSDLKDKVKEN